MTPCFHFAPNAEIVWYAELFYDAVGVGHVQRKDFPAARTQRTHQGPRQTKATASVSSGKDLYEEFSKKR